MGPRVLLSTLLLIVLNIKFIYTTDITCNSANKCTDLSIECTTNPCSITCDGASYDEISSGANATQSCQGATIDATSSTISQIDLTCNGFENCKNLS